MGVVGVKKVYFGEITQRSRPPGRWLAAAGLALACSVALAQAAAPAWFTVVGDPDDAATNTVQVDPAALQVDGDRRTLRMRVNRSAERTNPLGVKFRSFESVVLFDCAARTAGYVRTEFHALPLWKGMPHQVIDYPPGTVSPMAFRDMTPNPAPRIIRAACGV